MELRRHHRGSDDDSDEAVDDAGRSNRPTPFGHGGHAPPPKEKGPAYLQGRPITPSMVVSDFEKHYTGASGKHFAAELTKNLSFPHCIVDFEAQLKAHDVSEKSMNLLLLKSAVSGMAATFNLQTSAAVSRADFNQSPLPTLPRPPR